MENENDGEKGIEMNVEGVAPFDVVTTTGRGGYQIFVSDEPKCTGINGIHYATMTRSFCQPVSLSFWRSVSRFTVKIVAINCSYQFSKLNEAGRFSPKHGSHDHSRGHGIDENDPQYQFNAGANPEVRPERKEDGGQLQKMMMMMMMN